MVDRPTAGQRPDDGPAILFGVAVVAVFLVGFGGWAAIAPLESAAIALGSVKSEGNRKTIQHLEGGIVTKILVRDGDAVKAGQELIRLDETQANAAVELLRGRYWAAKALEARLIAERDGAERIAFPPGLPGAEHAAAKEAVASQARIFAARRAAIVGKTSILRQRVAALREEVVGLKSKIAGQTTQLGLIVDEIADVEFLVNKGLARKPRLLELQRAQAEIVGGRGENRALIARANERIAETELQILDLETTLANEVVKELREAERELYDVAERLRAAEDVIGRTRIVAPLDGVVVGLKVHTAGGVIAPGEKLMDIVPSGDRLIVEAQVDPADIDAVHPGLDTHVRLTPFDKRDAKPLAGRVMSVSADRLTDERTGTAYYLARIELLEDPAAVLGGGALYPGMPAEVMIVTGARTALDYFLKPIARSLNRAFREN